MCNDKCICKKSFLKNIKDVNIIFSEFFQDIHKNLGVIAKSDPDSSQKPELLQYARDNQNRRVGVFVAGRFDVDGEEIVGVGWSKCNITEDHFSKEEGIEIALDRAENGYETPIPVSIRDQYIGFIQRACRYFRDKKILF